MNPQRNLSRENFDFLIYEHQFQYEGFQQGWIAYSSEKMVVRVFEGRATPSLVLRVQSEPSFTEIQLGTVMESLGKLTRDQYEKRMDGHNIEENFAFIKSLFREFQHILLYQPELWWLDAQKLVYEKTASFYKRTGQSPADDAFFYNLYKYIKSKDSNWRPEDPINTYWEYLEKKRIASPDQKDEPN